MLSLINNLALLVFFNQFSFYQRGYVRYISETRQRHIVSKHVIHQ